MGERQRRLNTKYRKSSASSYSFLQHSNQRFFMSFDPIAAGEAAKEFLTLRKGKNYKKRTSKLEPFRDEISEMFRANLSLEVIQAHLESKHHLKASRSTILRYLHSIGVTRRG